MNRKKTVASSKIKKVKRVVIFDRDFGPSLGVLAHNNLKLGFCQ